MGKKTISKRSKSRLGNDEDYEIRLTDNNISKVIEDILAKEAIGSEKVTAGQKVDVKKRKLDWSSSTSKQKAPKKIQRSFVKESTIQHPSIRTRTTPKSLLNTVHLLKEPQKEVIRNIGFGVLLDTKLEELSGTLGFYVVDNLDVDKLTIDTELGPLEITPQVVHDMLGIPVGPVDFFSLPKRENNELFFSKWRSQFFSIKSLRPSNLAQALLNSSDTGIFFKLNFLTLFASTMLVTDCAGACSIYALKEIVLRVREDVDIGKVDWCSFVIHFIKSCKDKWNPLNSVYFFHGPMIILQLLYVQHTVFDKFPVARLRPALKCWNTRFLCNRVTMELEAMRNFGKLPIQAPVVEDNEDIVSYLMTISQIISKEEYLLDLGNILKKGVTTFPNDEKLIHLNEKFIEFFVIGKNVGETDVDVDEKAGEMEVGIDEKEGETVDAVVEENAGETFVVV